MSETPSGNSSPELTKPDVITLTSPNKREPGRPTRVNLERDGGSIIEPESIGISRELSTGQKVDVLGIVDSGTKQLAVMRIENPDGGDPNNQVYIVIGGLSPEDGKLNRERLFAIHPGTRYTIGRDRRPGETGRLCAADLWGPEAGSFDDDRLSIMLADWAGNKNSSRGGVGVENLSEKGATVTARVLASRPSPDTVIAPAARGRTVLAVVKPLEPKPGEPVIDEVVEEPVEPQPVPPAEEQQLSEALEPPKLPKLDLGPEPEESVAATPAGADVPQLAIGPAPDKPASEPPEPELPQFSPLQLEAAPQPAPEQAIEESEVAEAEQTPAQPESENAEVPSEPEQNEPTMQEIFQDPNSLAQALQNPQLKFEDQMLLRRIIENSTAAQTMDEVEKAWAEIAPQLQQNIEHTSAGRALIAEAETHLNQLGYNYSVLAHNIEEARTEDDWQRVVSLARNASNASEELESSLQRLRQYNEDLRRLMPNLSAMEGDHFSAVRRAYYVLNGNGAPEQQILEQVCKDWQNHNDPDMSSMLNRVARSIDEGAKANWRSRVLALEDLSRTTGAAIHWSDFERIMAYARNNRESVNDLVRFAVLNRTARDVWDIRNGAHIPGLNEQLEALNSLLRSLGPSRV